MNTVMETLQQRNDNLLKVLEMYLDARKAEEKGAMCSNLRKPGGLSPWEDPPEKWSDLQPHVHRPPPSDTSTSTPKAITAAMKYNKLNFLENQITTHIKYTSWEQTDPTSTLSPLKRTSNMQNTGQAPSKDEFEVKLDSLKSLWA